MKTIWIQQQNTLPEGMLEQMNNQKIIIKYNVDLLNGEERYNRKKEKKHNKKKTEYKRSFSSDIMDGVSSKSKTILLKIGKHIKKMKKSISDITKMNGLYLEQNTKNGVFSENKIKNGTFSKFNFKNINLDNLLNNDYNNKPILENINEKNFLSDNDTIRDEEKGKKEKYINNFMYVNDNYRKQLNFAFLKYNPLSHLDNLKILVQAEPSIRKDITKIKNEVEEDIKWKCDKFHFRKKYLNFISKNQRSQSVQPTPLSPKPIKPKFQKILPKIQKNNKRNKNLLSPQNSKLKVLNFYDKMKNRENQKYNNQKGQKLEEINHMLSATNEIDNLIKNENINDKIDLYKTDYAMKRYYTNNEVKNNNSLLEKDYFLEDKKRVEEKLGDVYCFQVARNADEKEKQLKGKINYDFNKFKKRIKEGKKNIIKEISTYIESNQLKIS